MSTIAFSSNRLWRLAQVLGVGATVVLVVALVWVPVLALPLLWNVLIPLLPITFLLSPLLWRGVCPLATLNTWPQGTRQPSRRWQAWAGAGGLVLLALMVPARRFLFNTSGTALALTIVAVALLALALGWRYRNKVGFCNTLCPVLPVEKLYGQAPLLAVDNARCSTCTLCVTKGCLDLVPIKALRQAVQPRPESHAWLRTPHGIFAAAFPGFVLGYFLTPDVALAQAASVYVLIFSLAGLSYGLVTMLAVAFRLRAVRLLPLLGGLALAIYYWFAAPSLAGTLGMGLTTGWLLRLAAFGLIGYWLVRALRQVPAPPQPAVAVPLPVHAE